MKRGDEDVYSTQSNFIDRNDSYSYIEDLENSYFGNLDEENQNSENSNADIELMNSGF